MSRAVRKFKRQKRAREKAEAWEKREQERRKKGGHLLARMLDPVWSRLPRGLQAWLTRWVRIPLMKFFVNFRPDPRLIGHAEKGEYASIPFYIHVELFPDGDVLYHNPYGRNRLLDPVKDRALVELVQHEYNLGVEAAKRAGVVQTVGHSG